MRTRTLAVVLTLFFAACGDSGGGATTTGPPSTPATSTSSAANTTAPVNTTAPAQTGPLRGFSLSPAVYDSDGILTFFEVAAPYVDFISTVTDMFEWEGDPGTATTLVGSVAPDYGFVHLSMTGVAHTEDGSPIRPLDEATFDRYVEAARTYAAAHQPTLLGLGVEIDTQARTHPEDFEIFVELFAAVAAVVAEVSPDTRMFTAFQLEHLSGLRGGLFGGTNDPTQADWELIERFPDADIIAFTTYPGIVFTSPDEIPDDYYSRLTEIVDGRPIAFTEMGWQAGGELGQWTGSPEKQAAFLERFLILIDEVDVVFYTWSFLFDQAAAPPFETMGLIAADGTERPGWEVWKSRR